MNKEGIILLIEDNRMDVELTLNAFKTHLLSNPVRVIRNGENAIDYLIGNDPYGDRAQYPLPDLILLDLKLPGLGGVDVLRTVKNRPKLKRIPIIILTSSNDEGDRALTYDFGANSYLVKPVRFEGFLEVVASIEAYWLTLNVSPPLC
jgi:CheY-like chemotaxis protein